LQARLLGIKDLDKIVEKLNGIVEKTSGVPEQKYVETQ